MKCWNSYSINRAGKQQRYWKTLYSIVRLVRINIRCIIKKINCKESVSKRNEKKHCAQEMENTFPLFSTSYYFSVHQSFRKGKYESHTNRSLGDAMKWHTYTCTHASLHGGRREARKGMEGAIWKLISLQMQKMTDEKPFLRNISQSVTHTLCILLRSNSIAGASYWPSGKNIAVIEYSGKNIVMIDTLAISFLRI